MESYGAHCVYVTDSGGALTMDGVRDRMRAYRARPRPDDADRHPRAPQPVARRGQLRRRRRGGLRPGRRLAGRDGRGSRQLRRWRHSSPSPTSQGWQHGCDLFALMDAAEDLVRPLQDRPVRVDRETLTPRLRRRLLQLPAPRRGRRRAVRPRRADDPAWSSASGAWSAARRT